jgi:2-phospho-L-lactate transferase/gluconeogenesis factor (CofD/UPF0052 family)
VIPHLKVPALRAALEATDARIVVVLNLDEQVGETPGFSPADHLAVFAAHAPGLTVHTVLADAAMDGLEELAELVEAYGASLRLADLALGDGTPRHDAGRLAAAYRRLMSEH